MIDYKLMLMSFPCALALALAHVLSLRIIQALGHFPRQAMLSLFQGFAISYFFLNTLPSISKQQEDFDREGKYLFASNQEVYVFALLGVLMYEGVEQLARRSREKNIKRKALQRWRRLALVATTAVRFHHAQREAPDARKRQLSGGHDSESSSGRYEQSRSAPVPASQDSSSPGGAESGPAAGNGTQGMPTLIGGGLGGKRRQYGSFAPDPNEADLMEMIPEADTPSTPQSTPVQSTHHMASPGHPVGAYQSAMRRYSQQLQAEKLAQSLQDYSEHSSGGAQPYVEPPDTLKAAHSPEQASDREHLLGNASPDSPAHAPDMDAHLSPLQVWTLKSMHRSENDRRTSASQTHLSHVNWAKYAKPSDDRTSLPIFAIHMSSFCFFNLLTGVVIPERYADRGTKSLVLFTFAMWVHYVGNHVSLAEHHRSRYELCGRWLAGGSVLVGWLLGVLVELPQLPILLITSFLTGTVIVNALKGHSTLTNKSFWAFCIGVVSYSLLLIFLRPF